MKKMIIALFIMAGTLAVSAQRNLVPVPRTQMLQIQLPEGSRQDLRFLSVAAASTFLAMSSEFKNLDFKKVEVYTIPGASRLTGDEIKRRLSATGYGVATDNADPRVMWFSKDNTHWMVYFSEEPGEASLYIGESGKGPMMAQYSSQPVIVASNQPASAGMAPSAAVSASYIPPLAGRHTGTRQQAIPEKEAGMVVYDLDSNRYHVVQLGKQYWLKENLRTTQYNDTTPIATGLGAGEWSKTKQGAYAVYDDKPANRIKYGLLYNGYAVASGKLCPQGWHVATDADWRELEKFLGIPEQELERTGERGDIAPKIKTTHDWNPSAYTADNSSGFSILPAGARLDNGEYATLNQYGNFWTSTVYDDRYGLLYLWNHHVHYNTNAVGRIYTVAQNGYSCRCVKDKD